MNRFFTGLGRFDVRFRWLIVAAWIVLTVVLTTTLPTRGGPLRHRRNRHDGDHRWRHSRRHIRGARDRGGSGSSGGQIQQIGYGIAAGVILDTFVVRTVVVPAIVTLLGRWNWWPSRLGTEPPVPEEQVA